mmetsp:Transcript_23762/g.45277  ORF Transcript_23762/g.45277 Transcript_23762/m.45277 type:complete len:649 (-) Transcript_23762:238-2184(-)
MEAPNFKSVLRSRLMDGMLSSVQGPSDCWNVLVVDELTVKIVSSACQMSQLLDVGVSLVENLNKSRQPQPKLTAVYFIQPTQCSVDRLIHDFELEKAPLYRTAHVFFSSKLPGELLASIKASPTLIARLESLKEVNLEVMALESRTFVTGNPDALEVLFGEHAESTQNYNRTIDAIASRLTTVFTALHELPSIRYHAPKAASAQQTASEAARARLAQRVASGVHARMSELHSLPGIPVNESCDLLVVDRSVDVVAPVIHEWTYEAMCFDLLEKDMQGEQFFYTTKTGGGKEEKKSALLNESDVIWTELRHLHIADVMLRISEKTKEFASKTKSSRQAQEGSAPSDMSTGQMKRLVETLPQYREQIRKLYLHNEVAEQLNAQVNARSLNALGKLEQDVVFGDAKSKDIIKLLGEKTNLMQQDKLRLLLNYMATHPEKLDQGERLKWIKIANLSADDINVVNNLEHLGVMLEKKSRMAKATQALSWGGAKSHQSRSSKHRAIDGEWNLSRFQPYLHTVLEELASGNLPEEEYPHVRNSSGEGGARQSAKPRGVSVRSARTARSSWAKGGGASKTAAGDDCAAISTGDLALHQKRLVLFVIGGITRSEIRAAHEVSKATGREVIIGSTSLDTPAQFLANLQNLSRLEDVEL